MLVSVLIDITEMKSRQYIHTHRHMYAYVYICTYTNIHVYTHHPSIHIYFILSYHLN